MLLLIEVFVELSFKIIRIVIVAHLNVLIKKIKPMKAYLFIYLFMLSM